MPSITYWQVTLPRHKSLVHMGGMGQAGKAMPSRNAVEATMGSNSMQNLWLQYHQHRQGGRR